MANIRFGSLVSDARGSVGGMTISAGRGGPIIRARRKPVNPRSALQEVQRGRQAYLARHWSHTLTAQQRADWNAYAAATSWTNKLGDSIEINGNAAFMRLSALLLLIGEPVRAEGPTAMGHAGGITITFDANTDTGNIEFDEPGGAYDKDLDDDWVIVFMGLPVEAGNARSRKGFRYIGSTEGDSGTAPTFPVTYTTAYTMVEGQNVTCKAIHIDPNFRVSSPVFYSELAAPTI